MAVPWRLLSGAPASAAGTMAIDAALLERAATPVLRLWSLSEAGKLVGANEAKVEPGAVRRPTGGGTFAVSPQAAGWSVLLKGQKDAYDAVDRVGCSVAVALERSGIAADFRDPDKLEADGKRVGWVGGASRDGAVLVQGVVNEAPEDFGVGFLEMLAEVFEADIAEGELTAEEQRPPAAAAEFAPLEGAVTGDLPTSGGMLRVSLVPGAGPKEIAACRFSGNYNLYPGDFVRRLEAAMAGGTIDDAPIRIEDFFTKNPGRVVGVEPGEFLTVLSLAFMKVRRTVSAAPDPNAWKQGGP